MDKMRISNLLEDEIKVIVEEILDWQAKLNTHLGSFSSLNADSKILMQSSAQTETRILQCPSITSMKILSSLR